MKEYKKNIIDPSGLLQKNIVTADEAVCQIKNLKILIAEDDEFSENLIVSVVKSFSDEIRVVRNGIEAVENCRKHSEVDLILMDIQMPEMSGYDATKEIRKFNKDVVIIAQTAYAMKGDREKALESGCNDYISKPILKDGLIKLLQKYFSKYYKEMTIDDTNKSHVIMLPEKKTDGIRHFVF